MGLDIFIEADNHEDIFTDQYEEEDDAFSLSREFCNLISRRNVTEHEAELDQIGKITGTDVSPIYEMEENPDDEGELYYYLDQAETEEERQKILAKAEEDSVEKLSGNIDKVLFTIDKLIGKLSTIENLPDRLIQTDFDTLNNAVYFSDFNIDKGKGYIDNNFGQDLRNFKRFLEFAKAQGTKTVWFVYG